MELESELTNLRDEIAFYGEFEPGRVPELEVQLLEVCRELLEFKWE
jgi:hypothetical protein